MKFSAGKICWLILLLGLIFTCADAQSRRSVTGTIDTDGTILSVVASRTGNVKDPIKTENLFLYENGIEQKIKNFSFDPSPAKIVMMVDNSQTVRADVELLKRATMEFAYEIFDGDQLFVVGYDEKPEIIQEWSDDAKKIETSLATFRKKGNSFLFDSLSATVSEILLPLMPGTRKTAIVLISDGLDRGSKLPFEKVLAELQNQNITVYALQIPDRTGGAFRRNQPKAGDVITQLAEGTGGKVFPIEEAQTAAKFICDELKKNRYLLNYLPTNTSSYDARRVFLIADEGIAVRTKNAQPPNVK
ncbi:MAG: VWA domain-containing protein [Acidobacteria bacterium]|nr:VWA domain-containing protein [Acidobacteriota bacterium]MBA4183304.1 VWA domain-containing protein [Acidobacteriota bacterium]